MVDEPLLEGQTAESWRHLSEQVQVARHHRAASATNDGLMEHIAREPDSPIAGPVLLWAADNLAWEARFDQAASLYAELAGRHAGQALGGVDVEAAALHPLAACQERFEKPAVAMETYQRLAGLGPGRFSPSWAHYQVGRVAEWGGLDKDAAEAYRAAADAPDEPARNLIAMPDLAARAAKRLQSDRPGVRHQPEEVAAELAAALRKRDAARLRELASPTHFMLGIGGHLDFHDATELVDRLHAELGDLRLDPQALTGHDAKRYLPTDGWQGEWFRGHVDLLITRSRDGWEWSGIVLTELTEPWVPYVEPADKPPNQVVDIPLKAPWPAGIHMRAGGLRAFVAEQGSIAAAAAVIPWGWTVSIGVTLALAARDCGFGPGVLYHDMWPTHVSAQDRFAVDFVRYQQFVPYHNIAGQTPALAAAAGFVSARQPSVPSGVDMGMDNRVEIQHGVLAPLGIGPVLVQLNRWKSKYLHLQGPDRIPVSVFMYVRQGARLGVMDDTGNSAFDHLHFSMHDSRNGDRAAKVTPLDGQSLDTGDDARCVRSSNVAFP